MFKEFQGFLTKYSGYTNKEMASLFQLSIKHESTDTTQTFLRNLEQETNLSFERYVEEPVYWESVKFKLDFAVSVTIDYDQSFDGNITELTITRKWDKKSGCDKFTYSIKVEKPAGEANEDAIISSAYLNAKEEDPETGKQKRKSVAFQFEQK